MLRTSKTGGLGRLCTEAVSTRDRALRNSPQREAGGEGATEGRDYRKADTLDLGVKSKGERVGLVDLGSRAHPLAGESPAP